MATLNNHRVIHLNSQIWMEHLQDPPKLFFSDKKTQFPVDLSIHSQFTS